MLRSWRSLIFLIYYCLTEKNYERHTMYNYLTMLCITVKEREEAGISEDSASMQVIVYPFPLIILALSFSPDVHLRLCKNCS